MIKNIFKSPKNWVPVTIVLAILIAGVTFLFSAGEPEFVEPVSVALDDAPEELVVMELAEFAVDEMGLRFMAPDGWRQITQDGHITFIHDSGSSMQVQINEYDPIINTIVVDDMAMVIIESGGSVLDFARLSTSAFFIAYELDGLVHMEMQVWDRQTNVAIVCIVDIALIEQYYDTFMYIFQNFTWERQDPIPEDFLILFNKFGNFEFGVPVQWISAITEAGMLVVTNPETAAIMYVSVIETDEVFDELTESDFIEAIGSNRENFVLEEFSHSDLSVFARATYSIGDVQYVFLQMLAANGRFQYFFSFEVPEEHIGTELRYFQIATQLFRFS